MQESDYLLMRTTNETPTLNLKYNQKPIFFKPTNYKEILQKIKDLKNKGGGFDHISAKNIKSCSAFLVNSLNETFKKCISIRVWSSPLK